MQFLNHTFSTPEENLACDEALLDLCEDGAAPEILRFWEPRDYFVVAGYSNKIQTEVLPEECDKQGIPILRRPSGGGTVLQGPGCLNYSLILRIDRHKAFQTLTQATSYIMEAHAKALLEMTSGIQVEGISDLTLNGLKFSGNAQRRKRNAFLFHGTFLLNFDLSKIETFLAMPSRRPAYRKDRSHSEFLKNLRIPASRIHEALLKTWNASEKFPEAHLPLEAIDTLVQEKYSRREWNFKF